jgi:putative tryptophan/tyrosine transport system substrate-binding protein
MKRREFIKLIGGIAASWPSAASAQQRSMPVIGFVTTTVKHAERFLDNVRKGLAEYGYLDGQHYRFDIRETNFNNDLGPSFYRDFVDQKVTLIIAAATLSVQRAKAATQSIPIISTIAADPVEIGLVASLNKPGGNVTGIFNLGAKLAGKRLEILRELVPSATKFAFLVDPTNKTLTDVQVTQIKAAASSLSLEILTVHARNSGEFEAAFESAVREGSGGMIIGGDALFGGGSASPASQLVPLAARYRLPAIYSDDNPVRIGGLISYAVDQEESHRTVGRYASRILKGEKPADIPVQLSTKTMVIINLKAAKALEIIVPTTLLGRAEEIIE